ncbi:hypothetical protein QE449_003756 [Rhodococcus sp. SORGH_AS303]|nr:hypothetical protein [Rhodococcus sp. SORGH_AS_0303]
MKIMPGLEYCADTPSIEKVQMGEPKAVTTLAVTVI